MARKTAAIALAGAIAFAGCSGGDGGGGGGAGGSHTISLDGGGGATTLGGGNGGTFYAETYQPGGVKLMRSGQADTSFDVPAVRASYTAGWNGATVTATQSVLLLAAGAADPGEGVLYLMAGGPALYKGDGAGTIPDGAEQVTGLSVRPGATLTVALNYDSDGNGTADTAYLSFPDDVEIAGTLDVEGLVSTETRWTGAWSTREATSRDSGGIYFESDQLFVRSGGRVDVRGGDAAAGSGEDGGCGGYFGASANDLFANEGTIDVSGGKGDGAGHGGHAGISSGWGGILGAWVTSSTGGPSGAGGMILNKGRLLASGGEGAEGGDAVYVDLEANSHVVNAGEITANGGRGTAGHGGAASSLDIYSYYGSVLNSAALTLNGGDGTDGGGDGGYVYLYSADSGYVGDIVNSGAITTSGGSATTAGAGGSGGEIYMYAYGGIRTSGALTLAGGAAAGAGNRAGDGGYLELYAYAWPYDYWEGYELPVRSIQISGNLALQGGAAPGGYGGGGGDLNVYQDGQMSSGQSYDDVGIEFLGYASASMSGGDGLDYGGDAFYNFDVYTYAQSVYVEDTPAGPIENEMDITIKGGNGLGADGDGGDGGYVYFEVDDYSGGALAASVRSSGAIDVSGGSSKGTSAGGDSGGVQMYAPGDVVNSGRILNRGGNAEDATGGTGNYYELWLVAGGDVVNSGSISTTGGSGADGGNGSDWWDYHTGFYAGGQVTNTATLESRGGASTDPDAGTAGDGGHIELFSPSSLTSNSGTLSVAAGAGGLTPGDVGEIWIDWVNVTPPSGNL